PAEVWYLLGAWLLAATMNAVLTWWGVSLALMAHPGLGNEILSREQLLSVVPVFVAVLVWLIRILLIGTFSMSGTRLFTPCRGSSTAQSLEAPPSGRKAPSLTEEIARRTPVRVIGDPPEGMEVPAPTRYPRPQHSPAPAPASPSRPPADPTRPFRPVPKPEPALSEDSNGHRNQFQNLLSSTPALRADVATASRDVATASRDVATASRDVATASRDVATADVATASRSRVASVPRLIRPLRRGAGD
ncbi:MAG: hypothetical protein HY784_09645, partial [Chloroflexi bacterium]|nr:hypothetical protein [Chloroflexota bacterium]